MSKIMLSSVLVSGEASLPGLWTAAFSLGGDRALPSCSLKGTNSIMRAHSLQQYLPRSLMLIGHTWVVAFAS